MGRDLAKEVKQPKYFESQIEKSSNEGTKEMAPLLPFVISGGKNTEYYYFKHINTIKGKIFNIIPEYFGKESEYTKEFPKRISEILKNHNDAKIFCVFDFDTVYGNKANKKRHEDFVEKIKENIDKGIVVLCPSMPSIEYWFLLHFKNSTDLIKTCGNKMNGLLTGYMKSYFPKSNKKIIDILKSEKYVKEPQWVKELCANRKLETAIKRAEENIEKALASNALEEQSYSYVYKVFKEVV
jgi:hypothetical protein